MYKQVKKTHWTMARNFSNLTLTDKIMEWMVLFNALFYNPSNNRWRLCFMAKPNFESGLS